MCCNVFKNVRQINKCYNNAINMVSAFLIWTIPIPNNDHKVHGRRIHCPDIMGVFGFPWPSKMRKKSTKYDDNALFSARNFGNYDRRKVMVQLLQALKLPCYIFLSF